MRNDLYGIMKPDEVRERLANQKTNTLEGWAHNFLADSMGKLRRHIESSEYYNLPKVWELSLGLNHEEFVAVCKKLKFWGWDETMYSTFHPEDPTQPNYGIVLNLENL